jgi:hypothetical protein
MITCIIRSCVDLGLWACARTVWHGVHESVCGHMVVGERLCAHRVIVQTCRQCTTLIYCARGDGGRQKLVLAASRL